MFGFYQFPILEAFQNTGYNGALEKLISIIESIPEEQIPVSAGIRIAHMYVHTGEVEKGMSILERLLVEQGPDLPYVTTGIKHFQKLESEPRFLAILEKMGLPPPIPG